MKQAAATSITKNSNYADWRQGDYTLGDQDFIYKYDTDNPITEASKAADKEESIVAHTVRGLVVVSQTCDIVKAVEKRPFVEVSPLVTLPNDDQFHAVKSGSSPRFAIIENLMPEKIVADLDRTMTVEKPVLEQWTQSQGFTTPLSRKKFAECLARKRMRPAFPNEFNAYMEPLRKQIIKKHGNDSPDGKAMAEIEEIRVLPEPDWEAQNVKIKLLFLLSKKTSQAHKTQIDTLIQNWLTKLDKTNKKYTIYPRLDYYSNFSAEDYFLSDRLDYDYLSE